MWILSFHEYDNLKLSPLIGKSEDAVQVISFRCSHFLNYQLLKIWCNFNLCIDYYSILRVFFMVDKIVKNNFLKIKWKLRSVFNIFLDLFFLKICLHGKGGFENCLSFLFKICRKLLQSFLLPLNTIGIYKRWL